MSVEYIYDQLVALQEYCEDNENFIITIYEKKKCEKNMKFYDLKDAEFSSCFFSNVLYGLDEKCASQLSSFIECILLEYPLLYTDIAVSSRDTNIITAQHVINNKNFYRTVAEDNAKLKISFVKMMDIGNLNCAANILLKKKKLRTKSDKKLKTVEHEKRKIEAYYKDKKLSTLHIELQNRLANTSTYTQLKRDLKSDIDESFKDIMPMKNIINLSRYLADEIFLRIQNKQFYVERIIKPEEFKDFDSALNEYMHEQIMKELNKIKPADSYEDFWDAYI